MKKKKVLFQSDFSLGKTGFGRNARALLTHLYKTGKYDIVHYCCGVPWSEPYLKKTPWRSIGALPDDPAEREHLQRDPNVARKASYGEYNLDKIIKQEKPDVYMAVQDIWGVDFAVDKPWFEKIHSVIWTTLDSMPILPSAIKVAEKAKNYWVWSDFATKALHELGHNHVKTVHGLVPDDVFKRLSDKKRSTLRIQFDLSADDYIVGFVFRNQLRKSVPNLLEGFSKFIKRNSGVKAKLLLHTHFGEGWDIVKLSKEYGLSEDQILTTYACRACHKYSVQKYTEVEIDCHLCGKEKGLITTNVQHGVTEGQLNEVYNLMDVYCHPFTSGGQEIPIQEAKLAELITLVTNYSCGEEMCYDEAYSLPLDWSEYREHGTEFIKASTSPASIANKLEKAYKMKPEKARAMGKKARLWVVDNFSQKAVGGAIEEFLDSLPDIDFDFEIKQENKGNPSYIVPNIEGDSDWLKDMYKNILGMEVEDNDEGLKYWLKQISEGANRPSIEAYFKQVASKESQKSEAITLESVLDKDDEGKRILFVMPESIGDIYMSTSLFKSLKELYPLYNLYVATATEQCVSVLDSNPYVHRVIPYDKKLEIFTFTEGSDRHNGYFEISFTPFFETQRLVNYVHNGKDKLAFDIKY